MTLKELLNAIRAGRSVEVSYNDRGEIIVTPYRGVRKIQLNKKELKGIRGVKRRVRKEILAVLEDCLKPLIKNRVPFRIIFGRGDAEIRFTIDQYVRLARDGARVVGFEDNEEWPLNLFFNELERLGRVRFLRPIA